jgi:cell shape-determining protein MreC
MSSSEVVAIAVAFLALVSTVTVAIIGWVSNRKKTHAETGSTIVTSATTLVDRLEHRLDEQDEHSKEQDRTIEKLSARIEDLESEGRQLLRENTKLRSRVSVLEGALRTAGIPVPE